MVNFLIILIKILLWLCILCMLFICIYLIYYVLLTNSNFILLLASLGLIYASYLLFVERKNLFN